MHVHVQNIVTHRGGHVGRCLTVPQHAILLAVGETPDVRVFVDRNMVCLWGWLRGRLRRNRLGCRLRCRLRGNRLRCRSWGGLRERGCRCRCRLGERGSRRRGRLGDRRSGWGGLLLFGRRNLSASWDFVPKRRFETIASGGSRDGLGSRTGIKASNNECRPKSLAKRRNVGSAGPAEMFPHMRGMAHAAVFENRDYCRTTSCMPKRTKNRRSADDPFQRHKYPIQVSERTTMRSLHDLRAMSAQFQNRFPHSRPGELHWWLPVAIQSSLSGAHSLGHEGGSNSSYPGDLQPMPESGVRDHSWKLAFSRRRGGKSTTAYRTTNYSSMRLSAAAMQSRIVRVCHHAMVFRVWSRWCVLLDGCNPAAARGCMHERDKERAAEGDETR